jgi:hypothetical protein
MELVLCAFLLSEKRFSTSNICAHDLNFQIFAWILSQTIRVMSSSQILLHMFVEFHEKNRNKYYILEDNPRQCNV